MLGEADQPGGRRHRAQGAVAARPSLSADAADVSRAGRVAVRAPIIALLRTQQVQLSVVQPDGLVTGPGGAVATAGILTPADVAELKAGKSFSEVRHVSGGRYYLEGRAIPTGAAAGRWRGPGAEVADARSAGSQVGLRLLIALIAGLVVAALAGVLLARRLARPLAARRAPRTGSPRAPATSGSRPRARPRSPRSPTR